MNPHLPLLLGLAVICPAVVGATALDHAALAEAVRARFEGDRSGACIAAAVVDEGVATAIVCADPTRPRPIRADTRFELGSVGKTMTAAVLADAVARGELSLDTPLLRLLPEAGMPGTPRTPLRLWHLVSHSSGLPRLPPGFAPRDESDPYADFTVHQALDSLRQLPVGAEPGTRFEYSNFGFMLLSLALERSLDADFGDLLRRRVFEPLGMRDAGLCGADAAGRAQGHLGTGAEAPAWTVQASLAGAGGVCASLDDMVRYVAAQLGRRDTPLAPALLRTQQPMEGAPAAGAARVGMAWMLQGEGDTRRLWHDGGTGGFSSVVMLDPAGKRGVVLLSDTSLVVQGGLDALALHLLDPTRAAGTPRRAATPAPALLEALQGDYVLEGGLPMTLRVEAGRLVLQAEGQPAFPMGYDSHGDFHPLAFDALLTPPAGEARPETLRWQQGGARMTLTRQAPASRSDSQSPADPAGEYLGTYPLAPQFVLRVFQRGSNLQVQATGQGPLVLEPLRRDVFRTRGVDAEIHFRRDASGRVVGLALHQNGLVQEAARE